MGAELVGIVFTYDADMNFVARLPLFRDLGVGDTVRYAARGEYVVFKVEDVEGERRFHAIEPEGWEAARSMIVLKKEEAITRILDSGEPFACQECDFEGRTSDLARVESPHGWEAFACPTCGQDHHLFSTNPAEQSTTGGLRRGTEIPLAVRRYWFEFDSEPVGYGVTAHDREDAMEILRQALFRGDLPRCRRIIEDVDISTLDAGHVLPNMAPPNRRGIWFPPGY